MNATQLKRFRTLLEKEFEATASEIADHAGRITQGSPEVETAIINSDENLLEKIEFALARIDEGTYGACVDCGSDIPLERLEAKPAVSLCTGCQEKKEALQDS